MKSCIPLPKNKGGSLHLEWKTCGKASCRCSRGVLHGPYVSFRWRADGRQRRRYVRLEELSDALDAHKRKSHLRVTLRELKGSLKGI